MRTRLNAILAAACAGAAVIAQERPAAQDTPTFRAQANLVRVDMYATLNGALVTDLRPQEVEVYEDGVLQAAIVDLDPKKGEVKRYLLING